MGGMTAAKRPRPAFKLEAFSSAGENSHTLYVACQLFGLLSSAHNGDPIKRWVCSLY